MAAMRKIDIPCRGLRSEAAFWNAYLDAVKPDGAGRFGRNLDAFRDALLGGGPGWPGECELRLVDSTALSALREGTFLERLEQIAGESESVRLILA